MSRTSISLQSLFSGFPAILSLEIEPINATIAKWQKVTDNGNRILHLTN
jgi:hypothetical protein